MYVLTLETEIKQRLTLETEIKTCTYPYLPFPLFNISSITCDFHWVDISADDLLRLLYYRLSSSQCMSCR